MIDENVNSQETFTQNSSLNGRASFLKTKKTYLFLLISFILILIGIVVVNLIIISVKKQSKSSQSVISHPKTWEITMSYDTKNQKLSLEKLSVLDKEIRADYMGAKFSPYELLVSNNKDETIYKTKVNITEQLYYDILDVNGKLPETPRILDTTVYIPYQSDAVKIRITKNNETILEIVLPKSSSFKIIPNVYAASSYCRQLITVFISENYTDFNKYHSDVERLRSAFISTPPYSSKPGIFDFKIIDNNESLGCLNGIFKCITNPRIQQIGRASYPNASKFIVVVNNPNAASVDGDALGVTNSPGGDTAVFTNRTDLDSLVPNIFTKVAIHEFLGHAVGVLYDRYIYPLKNPDGSMNPNGNLRNIIPKSNCTIANAAPSFWNASQTYPGCTSQYLDAPSPRNCVDSRNGKSIPESGTTESIMSAAICGATGFDTVEQTWIKDSILPYYSECAIDTPTQTPTQTPTPVLTATPTPIITLTPTPTGTEYTKIECVVKNDEITNQSCSYDQVKDQTDWCRSGKWHCESYDFPYQFQNWCKP
ncbi:MAG: hypothetical protein M1268_01040, partial [Patescibacteria group bacterium]|nr:hypothetical protein [Patescibacteria group bacterium]